MKESISPLGRIEKTLCLYPKSETAMVQLQPDIIARIRMYTKAEGGKSKTISGEQFGCPLYYQNEGFECRLFLAGNMCLRAGDIAELPIKFLFPEHIKPRLQVGDAFTLWDLSTFAVGEVLHVCEEVVVGTFCRGAEHGRKP